MIKIERSTVEDPKTLRLKNCDVRYCDPQDFKNLFKIGTGGFASVYIAKWKITQSTFAIKKFYESFTKEEIINEVELMVMVGLHPNIIGFRGITKFKDEKNYSLVLEYADGGTLREYLRRNFTTFKWESQLKFAKEISSAILCLHDHKIIHRDLHPDNILIDRNTAKLADFGCSYLQGSDYRTKVHGVIPYMDPNIFQRSDGYSYDLTEKSDVYSLGVLFWELTSCSSPFNFENLEGFEKERIALDILRGIRESPVSGTDCKFVGLYEKCWQLEPDKRPDIRQVILELDGIDSGNNNADNVDSENKNLPVNLNSKKSEETEVLDDHSDCDLQKFNF